MSDPQHKRRCDRCIFFEPEPKARAEREATYGYCHRYAPRPVDKQSHAYWPVVASHHWCGEYFVGRQD
ncbi:MAG: hypothetical protein ACYS4W_06985 [Planctomycetota bacterium]